MSVSRLAFPLVTLVAGAALLCPPAPLDAQDPATPAASRPDAPARGLRGREELEAFLDGVMAADLARHHVAGATVSVVKDGQLLFAKGYGYADVERRTPVDPEKTLFRVGSITKLFTWTAVMQLVEQGKLDLRADVNQYLDFTIPATFPQPITLTHILTHTPGLEEDGLPIFGDDPRQITPAGTWLPANMPVRVRAPGVYASYSNWASALAGYIVERVSGVPWDDYIERHILGPLGMMQTTGRQPLPDRFAVDMSLGYRSRAGRFVQRPWVILIGVAPAGSISATATDIATFMIAHLNGGEYDGQRILSSTTATLMQSRLHGHDARLPGFAHGFQEKSRHSLRLIGHSGSMEWFHSDLALLPSEKVGVFVSYNTNTGEALSSVRFLEAFLDHYYPEPPTRPATLPTAPADAMRVEGEYLSNRMNFTTYRKARALDQSVRVDADSDGSIVVTSPGGVMRMVEVDTLLYRSELGGELLAFQADSTGRVVRAFSSVAPLMVLDRQTWLQSPRMHRSVQIGGLALFVGFLAAALMRACTRPRTKWLPGASLLVGIAAAHVVFGILWVSMSLGLVPRGRVAVAAALVLPVSGAILTSGALWKAVTHWRAGASTLTSRVAYSAMVLAALLFAWSLHTWNLLGWRL